MLFKNKTAFVESIVHSLLVQLNETYLGSCYPVEITQLPYENIPKIWLNGAVWDV
jgi:hypothetical protein